MSDKYNGWANYKTWNVALWVGNDEGLYHLAKDFTEWEDFAKFMREDLGSFVTPDGVAWNDSGLDLDALDEMLAEL